MISTSRPWLAPHCKVTTSLSTSEIFIVSDVEELRLSGELFAQLSTHLNGLLTIAEITEIMVAAGTASAEEVPAAIAILEDRGFLLDAAAGAEPDDVYRMWSGAGSGKTRIRVTAVGETPIDLVMQSLESIGFVVTDVEPDLRVLLVDDYLNPQLPDLASTFEGPVLLASLAGPRPTIGPWLVDGGPCYECLASRLRFNRQVEQRLLADGDRMGPVVHGWTEATAAHATVEIALAVQRWRLGAIAASMLVIDHLTGERTEHRVVRRPQCPACGTAMSAEIESVRITLEAGALDAKDDGSYRRLTPAQTLDRYGHHVSRITGVVEGLQPMQQDNDVVFVVESGVNLATMRKGSTVCGFRQSAGGKGTTSEQARAGALAEAIERYSASYTGEEPTIVASMDDLGNDAIDPRTTTLFSDAQYAEREAWNVSHKGMHRIPVEFDPAVAMEWSPVWSFTRDQPLWVPTPMAYYLYSANHPANGCRADSNGNAAGTSIEDAILQGFFELVERDAVATWWYNRIPRPGVDFGAYRNAFDEPYFDRFREHYETSLDREVWALDVTSDLGIPAFVAASRARSGNPRVLLGFGAHRDARGALLRAMTEMNQMLGMIPAMEAAPDAEPDPMRPEVSWWSLPSLDDHAYVLPTRDDTTPDDHLHDWTTDGRQNVLRVEALVEQHNMELHVMNMTRPDIDLPVVKVIVPGMRHFWPRYAPGRLYDVPVTMGWLTHPSSEAELNPTPIFW